MPEYKPATVVQLDILVHKLQDLFCYERIVDDDYVDRELCRMCDVKALALLASFRHPRFVEDVGPGAHIPSEEQFEELPF